MKKYPRFLTVAIVVSMIAALPASAQIDASASGTSNLALLIPINRLELTEEQMVGLHEILSSLLEAKDGADSAVAAFEQVMIEFNGTREELDELVASFREDQRAQMDVMRESVAASLDAIGDLLSINQGSILREELPELLGLGSKQGARVGSLRLQDMPSAMGRRGMMAVRVGSHLQGVIEPASGGVCEAIGIQPSGQNSYWNEVASSAMPSESASTFGLRGMQSSRQPSLTSRMMQSSAERDLMLRGMQTNQSPDLTSSTMENRDQRGVMLRMLQDSSGSGLPEMIQQRLGQISDIEEAGAMREQMQLRIEQFSEQMPDELRERIGQRMSGRSGIGIESPMMMRGQISGGLQQVDHGNLFDLLEQVAEVLELKLDALE